MEASYMLLYRLFMKVYTEFSVFRVLYCNYIC